MKSKIWKIPYSKPVIPPKLLAAGYTPLLAAVLNLRGITTADEAARLIRGSESCLHDPMLMKGMPAAVERVHRAISSGETVAVYGDYDVDGITSTCLLTQFLLDSGLPRDATALQAIGYKQFLAVAEGTATTEEAIAEVKLRSRQYAKRQLTWLRRNPDIFWVRWQRQPNFPEGLQKATEYLHSRGLC